MFKAMVGLVFGACLTSPVFAQDPATAPSLKSCRIFNSNCVNDNFQELVNRINILAGQVDALAKQVNDLTTGLKAISQQISDPTTGLKAVSQQIGDPTTGLKAISQQVSDPTTGLKAVNQQISNLAADIKKLKDEPPDPQGSFLLKQDRSGFCLTFGDNQPGNRLISFLACDRLQDQRFHLSRP